MIQLFQANKQKVSSDQLTNKIKLTNISRHLSQNWEIYIILILSSFLHLANINNAIFNSDEANVYRMAHDAITSGWLPLTSDRASLGNFNPPLVTYLFMIPAAFSSNPLWGEVMVVLFTVAAILLTYFFVRRYYGRLAGTIASLLFATSAGAWTFSRNIWNQNFLPFFVMLFMFLLFRGVVERRKGWLLWAILLLGVLYQLHGSALYLFIPLVAAVCFAYKTIRLRDIALGIAALLLLFAPYILWEFHVHFIDVTILFSAAKQQPQIDTEALRFYLFYIHPVLTNPYIDLGAQIRDTHLLIPDGQSILAHSHLLTLLSGVYLLSVLLLLGGILIAVTQIFALRLVSTTEPKKNILDRWWGEFQADPARQGLVLILLWQIAPLLLLTRHSIVLFVHYFIFFLPGQFILIALCLKQIIALATQFRPSWAHAVRYSVSILAVLLILAQLIGVGSANIDISAGHFQSAVFSDVSDQSDALQVADRVAQQRHIHRIYLTAFPSYIKMDSMQYLSQQIKTPVDFFTSDNCFILPAPAAGPVVFLTTSDNSLADTLFSQYANAALVATSPHLGSSPYLIYVLTAKPEPAPVSHAFNSDLQLLSPHAQLLQGQWLTTRWSVPNAHTPAFRTTYGFHFQVHSVADSSVHGSLDCTPTLTWPGDQLFVFYTFQHGDLLPAQIAIQVSTFMARPQTFSFGPVTGFTDQAEYTNWQTLLTDDHKDSVILPTTDEKVGG